jgi:eukaryotic-like serine/threonine-protein kinase
MDRNPPSNRMAGARDADGSAPAGAPAVPVHIPDHQLLRRIGRGSYGEVWLARNPMGLYRAVKIVHRQAFEQQRPFERELSGIRKFEPLSRSHEGFIDILHVGLNLDQGYFFYVMELGDDPVSGQEVDLERYTPKTLASEISAHGRLPIPECLRLGLALSLALAELHKHGLVHRDVKPSNIIFVHGVPKLADIGLVAGVDETRSYVGTEGFIPPEGPGTPEADVFGLGKVLYEAGTGKDRQAFPELPTRLDRFADYDGFLELNEVILQACQNDPRRRYRSAWEMHADLLVLANGRSVKRLKFLERRVGRLKRFAGLGGLALLALAAVCYQVYREWQSAAESRQRQVGANVAYGNRAMESGDLSGALPYFAEALRLDLDRPQRTTQHHLRLESVLRQCPRLVQLWVAPRELASAQFGPDGRSVLAVERNGQAQILQNNAPASASLRFGQNSGVTGGALSPRGGWAVTASLDGTACVWRVEDGVEVLTLEHPDQVLCASYSPDGQRLVTGSQDGVARIWDARSGDLQLELRGHTNAVLSARFSSDGEKIVTAGRDGTARVWDAREGRALGSPLCHSTWVTCAAFSPDARLLVTACFDHQAHVWDIATGQSIPPALDHRDGVFSAEFSPDGRLMVTAGLDHTARLWRTADHQPLTPNPVLRHSDRVVQACFDAAGHRVLTACADGTVRVWDLAGMEIPPWPTRRWLSPEGSRFAIITNRLLRLGNTGSEQLMPGFVGSLDAVAATAFSRDGRFVLAVSEPLEEAQPTGRQVEVCDAATGNAIAAPLFFPGEPARFALSDDGRCLLSWTGQEARCWEVISRKPLSPPIHHDMEVQAGVFSPDGTRAATWGGDEFKVWSTRTGREFFPPMKQPAPLAHAAFSPDGRRLITCGAEPGFRKCSAQVWDVATGQAVGPPLDHADGILFAAFSPDGRRVVTASEDFTAMTWDAVTGRALTPPLRHEHQVQTARFSPDGRWIVTASSDRTARLWDAETGDPLTPPLRHMAPLADARFDAGGRRVITADVRGNSWTWELPAGGKPVADLLALAGLLSGVTFDPSGQPAAPPPDSLFDRWQRLRLKYPAGFTISDHELAAWHEFQAEQCRIEGHAFGAGFHRQQRLALQNSTSP